MISRLAFRSVRRAVAATLAFSLAAAGAGFRSASASVAKAPIPIASGTDGYTYFPTGNTGAPGQPHPMDGRMIALASAGNATLSGTSLDVRLGAPAGAASLEIGVFDGDQKGYASGGSWDQGAGTRTLYQLYANPNNVRFSDLPAGSQPLETWTSDQMPDNAWCTLGDLGAVAPGSATGITNRAAAQAAGGNYFYLLHISLENPAVAGLINAFKLRARSPMAISPTNFGLMVPYNGTAVEQAALYPASGTTYDGTWNIYLDVPQSVRSLGVWDGDFDFGDCNSWVDLNGGIHTTNVDAQGNPAPMVDADDADTNTWVAANGGVVVAPTAPRSGPQLVPPFAAKTTGIAQQAVSLGTVVKQNGVVVGYRTGGPADDNGNALLRRSPAINYSLVDPNGNVYYNGNPSGNMEWERFQVTSDPAADWHTADYGPGWGTPYPEGNNAAHGGAQVVRWDNGIVAGQNLPAGIWQIAIQGMDLGNLNTLFPDNDALGVDINGNPISLLRAYLIGRTVWSDLNNNGVQDAGEPGIPGVRLNLVDSAGTVLATTTTDLLGNYWFWVDGGTYTVVVDPCNGQSGSQSGPLCGMKCRRGDYGQAVIAANNCLTLNFGYATVVAAPAPATLGGLLYTDVNHNRLLETGTDTLLSGVTVTLTPVDGSGNPTGAALTTTTDNSGAYSFPGLAAGSYQVTVPATTAGQALETPGTLTVTVAAGANSPNNHFAYRCALTLSGASAVTLTTDPGLATAAGTRLTAPTVTDSCFRSVPVTSDAPASLAIGTRVVTWTATDAAGNSQSFVQTVTVVDAEAPKITAPADVTVSADAGQTTASGVCLGAPVTSDNNGVASVNSNAPAVFPAGSTPVVWTVTDLAGNTATATQVVTVTVPSAAISGMTYTDKNGNGSYDAGTDAVLAGVTVKLTGKDKNGKAVSASAVTAADGSYRFGGLEAGSYTVSGASTSGSQVLETAASLAVSLASGNEVKGNHFGYVAPVTTGALTTYTQGGWHGTGAPGKLLVANFTKVYGTAGVTIGGANTLTFTSAAAVQAFLPQSSTPVALTQSATDPTGGLTVLAGQVLALELNVDFSSHGVTRTGLASLKIKSGAFAGKTVSEFLQIANAALGGGTSYSLSDVNATADAINNNYDNGTQDLGYLSAN